MLHTLKQTPLYQHRSSLTCYSYQRPRLYFFSFLLATLARLGRTLAHLHPPAPAPCPFACFQVMADSRLRAEAEPLRLSRNWFVAVVISLLWLAGLEYCLYLGINTWGEYCMHSGNQNR